YNTMVEWLLGGVCVGITMAAPEHHPGRTFPAGESIQTMYFRHEIGIAMEFFQDDVLVLIYFPSSTISVLTSPFTISLISKVIPQ
ncbi:MAG: hypothetical protein NT077_00205, partial [Candidatus Taylorbacteria bacterium]|nr:hypothetical protein [Candidatus Taylorbacteria bacterium]